MLILRYVRPRYKHNKGIATPADVLYGVVKILHIQLGKCLFSREHIGNADWRMWGYALEDRDLRPIGRVSFVGSHHAKGKAEIRFFAKHWPLAPLKLRKFKGWYGVNIDHLLKGRRKEKEFAKLDTGSD